MKLKPALLASLSLGGLLFLPRAWAEEKPAAQSQPKPPEMAQVPTWSRDDLDFFLHGSMSTEFAPETVLRAFIRTYPDLFPTNDLSHLGLIPDPAFGWPVGFSRSKVPHLGGLPAVGINCASCHVTDTTPAHGGAPVRVLGGTSHFDAEAFFGSVIVATFRTADPANMKKFLAAHLAVTDPAGGEKAQEAFASEWERQKEAIAAVLASDPAKNPTPGALLEINAADLPLDSETLAKSPDLPKLARTTLALFHNMRAALHVPDQPPDKAPPASGPGRNDAFGILSLGLFGVPQPYAPVKFGLVWNLDQRHWVHWDGNTQSPLGRNILAALGLGAPLTGHHGGLEFALVKRHTDLTEKIRAPRYPFTMDEGAAQRGAAHFASRCASCHTGPEGDQRLHDPAAIGTDPNRAKAFTQAQADLFNNFFAELETPGYTPPAAPPIRGTGKYFSPTLAGVWARSPYLHNGSIRTLRELLTPPAARAKTFRRGSHAFDTAAMGYADEGPYLLDTTAAGSSNTGHDYGTDLSAGQKGDLIEYLKTL